MVIEKFIIIMDVEDKEKEEIVKEIFNVGEKLLNTSLESS